jgi:phosphoglucomutase
MLANIPRLMTAYYTTRPDPSRREQGVAFGTSGHRGSALVGSFNEAHILAITQAIYEYRRGQGIDGPLFLGIDTHALSELAFASALEVLAAHGAEVMIDDRDGYTPTPVISHAILTYNRGRTHGLADGIVVTPSHKPARGRRFQVQPAARRTRRHSRDRMDPGTGERAPRRRSRGGGARPVRASAPCVDDAPL